MNRYYFFIIISILFISSSSVFSEHVEIDNEITFEILSLDELMSGIEGYVDSTIAVNGIVDHVCRHDGKKLNLTDSMQVNEIHVKTSEYISVFDDSLNGLEITLVGVLRELKIDEEYLEKWESEVIAEGGEHIHEIELIEELRKKIKDNEKGYISDYWIECFKIL